MIDAHFVCIRGFEGEKGKKVEEEVEEENREKAKERERRRPNLRSGRYPISRF